MEAAEAFSGGERVCYNAAGSRTITTPIFDFTVAINFWSIANL